LHINSQSENFSCELIWVSEIGRGGKIMRTFGRKGLVTAEKERRGKLKEKAITEDKYHQYQALIWTFLTKNTIIVLIL
jgi:hypothetical protein